MIKVQCTSCGKSIGASEKHAGKIAKCPGCQSQIKIPLIRKPVAPEPPPATVQALPTEAMDPLATDPDDPLGLGITIPKPVDDPFANQNAGGVLYSKPKNIVRRPRPAVPATADVLAAKRQKDEENEDKVSIGRSIGGLVAAIGVALLCTFIWLIIWAIFQNRLGLVALGIGCLIGLVAGVVARNPSPIYCTLAAMIAGLCFFGTKIIMAMIVMSFAGAFDFVKDQIELASLDPQHADYSLAMKDQMLDERRLSTAEQEVIQKQVGAELANNDPDLLTDEEWKLSDAVDQRVNESLKKLTREEKVELIVEAEMRHPKWIRHDYHYYGVLNYLLVNDEIRDPEVKAHAEAIRDENLTNTYPDEYYRNASDNQLENRNAALKELVETAYSGMSFQQRDEALRSAIAFSGQWMPIEDDFYAVMESMVTKREFEGDILKHAKNTVDLHVMEMEVAYFDTLNDDENSRRTEELTRQVNEELVKLDSAQRWDLVSDLKTRVPYWSGGFGVNEQEHEFEDEFEEMVNEFGDGTFSGSYKAVSSWRDFIYFFLCVGGAFFVARYQGNDGI